MILILAFVVAPHSCEGGLQFYFWSGITAGATLVALPFLLRMSRSFLISLGWAIAFLIFGACIWLTGIFVANVRIICKMF